MSITREEIADDSCPVDPRDDQLEVELRLAVANQQRLNEYIEDCREIMVLIAQRITEGDLLPHLVDIPPSIILLPFPRLQPQTGDLEIAVYSLDTRSYSPDKCSDMLAALKEFSQFPNKLHAVQPEVEPKELELKELLAKKEAISFEQAVILLEALTVYIEKITGVTNDLSSSRNADFAGALPLLQAAQVAPPTPGQFERYGVNGQEIVIDDLHLWAFKDQLLVFIATRIPSVQPEAAFDTLTITVPDGASYPEGYRPQSLLPEGTALGAATHGLILEAMRTGKREDQ